MKVRFLKKHLSHQENAVAYVDEGVGNYLIKMKVVELFEESRSEDDIMKGYEKKKVKKK